MTAAVWTRAAACGGIGCCPGCDQCWGMQFGCHQNPCRCHLPCRCNWDRWEEPGWQDGCERHDATDDGRWCEPDIEPEDFGHCPICGESGRCSEDDEGRPLFHTGAVS